MKKAIAVLDNAGKVTAIIPLPCELGMFGRLLMAMPEAETMTCEGNLQNGHFEWTPDAPAQP